ncbi:WD40/YVTN/BNR-like repeat-containing protein [Aliidiomarina indica]|uniref:WD40/YVTN/BNR-like repeat-containing protein n=1 Tax=Aliidiomarina indica TaxID=2749147 RepID=UPI00188F191D|nr:YCF48-related protein [Aliidiomarina indica]
MKRIALAGLVAAILTGPHAFAEAEVERYDPLFTPAPQARLATEGKLVGLEQVNGDFFAVGALGTVVKYHGEGDWVQKEIPTSVLLTAVYAVDQEHIWAVGHEGVILQSTDGGESWEFRLDGHQLLDMEYAWLQEREIYLEDAIADAEDDYEREDLEFRLDELMFHIGGAEIQFEVGPTKPFLDVLFFNRDVGVVIGAYGTILRTTDGGESWDVKNAAIDNPVGYHPNKLVLAPDDTLILVGESGLLARSDDQGETFDMLESPYHGSLFGALFDQENQLWVYGLRGNVFVSDDDGESFTDVQVNTRYNINSGTVLADGRVVLVGHSGVIIVIDPDSYESTLYSHETNSPLSGVRESADNTLILVGRAGLQTFQLPARIGH